MTTKDTAAAATAESSPRDKDAQYEAFLSRLSAKNRTSVDRHVAACDAEGNPDHAVIWKRLAGALAGLAPHAVEAAAQSALQFFVADGKYRMQVFALEDLRQGTIAVYANDVLDRAVKAGAVRGPDASDPTLYRTSHKHPLKIETLTAATTASAPNYYRHMLGWNRRAIRILIPTSPVNNELLQAVEAICRLAVPQPAAEKPQQQKAEKEKAAPAAAKKEAAAPKGKESKPAAKTKTSARA